MAETTCPVFRPTMEEFSNFSSYMDTIETKASRVGLCKIIPPQEWLQNNTVSLDDMDFNIQTPVKQCLSSGAKGVFSVDLVETKPMTLAQFKVLAAQKAPKEPDAANRVRNFWRGLGSTMDPPIYGADTPGTVFCGAKDGGGAWNVDRLDSMLQLLRDENNGEDLPGVTRSMLYVGMWKAMFAFHTEDVNLCSINYVHAGAEKSWYAIAPEHGKRFEALAEGYFAEGFLKCKEFLRHKTCMLNPNRLHDAGIPFTTCLQTAGEFVITWPASYHAGFNHGLNVAESSNFAIEKWLESGIKARYCKCRPYVVHINMERMSELYKNHLETYGEGTSFIKDYTKKPLGHAMNTQTPSKISTCDGTCGSTNNGEATPASSGEGGENAAKEELRMTRAVIPLPLSTQKKSSSVCRHRLTVGKEVMVAQGDTFEKGLVKMIEDGHARIHYGGGKKCRQDEWLPLTSDRFLSLKDDEKRRRQLQQLEAGIIKKKPQSGDIKKRTRSTSDSKPGPIGKITGGWQTEVVKPEGSVDTPASTCNAIPITGGYVASAGPPDPVLVGKGYVASGPPDPVLFRKATVAEHIESMVAKKSAKREATTIDKIDFMSPALAHIPIEKIVGKQNMHSIDAAISKKRPLTPDSKNSTPRASSKPKVRQADVLSPEQMLAHTAQALGGKCVRGVCSPKGVQKAGNETPKQSLYALPNTANQCWPGQQQNMYAPSALPANNGTTQQYVSMVDNQISPTRSRTPPGASWVPPRTQSPMSEVERGQSSHVPTYVPQGRVDTMQQEPTHMQQEPTYMLVHHIPAPEPTYSAPLLPEHQLCGPPGLHAQNVYEMEGYVSDTIPVEDLGAVPDLPESGHSPTYMQQPSRGMSPTRQRSRTPPILTHQVRQTYYNPYSLTHTLIPAAEYAYNTDRSDVRQFSAPIITPHFSACVPEEVRNSMLKAEACRREGTAL